MGEHVKLDIKKIDPHRNGISGESFNVVHFGYTEGGINHDDMIATVFDAPGHVAVLKLSNLNSCWRGDNFEKALRQAIDRSSDR